MTRARQAHSTRIHRLCTGFTLVEILVALGVLAVIIAMLIPAIVATRRSGLRSQSLVQCKGIAMGLFAYANDYSDLPPAIFRPQVQFLNVDPAQEWTDGVVTRRGFWFTNSYSYPAALRPFAPGLNTISPRTPDEVIKQLPPGVTNHYLLTETLYAAPALFTLSAPVPSLLKPQEISKVTYPSRKGLLQQVEVYFEPKARDDSSPNGVRSHWASTNVLGAIAWADASASMEYQGLLQPGISNPYDPLWFDSGGFSTPIPILRTREGIFGVDR
jgi:prepilin-type N-terminal cleavage/methylation domain-containing protein